MKKNKYIFDVLKNRIIDGTYRVNSFLPSERALADEFQVSRVPVRQAIEQLIEEKCVKKTGRKMQVIGFQQVKIFTDMEPMSSFEQEKLYFESLYARRVIESQAAYEAAIHASAKQIDDIRLYFNNASVEMNNCRDYEDVLYQKADYEFHKAITMATGNDMFVKYMEEIQETIHSHQYLSMKYRYSLSDVNDYHERIYQAIVKKQPEKAYQAMYDHLSQVIDLIIKKV